MLLVKRELWRGPLCRHLSLQLPEIVAGMALQLEPALWDEGGGGVEAERRKLGAIEEGQWGRMAMDLGQKHSLGVFRRQFCQNLLVSFQVGFSLILSSSLGWDSLQEESTNTLTSHTGLGNLDSVGQLVSVGGGQMTGWGGGGPAFAPGVP